MQHSLSENRRSRMAFAMYLSMVLHVYALLPFLLQYEPLNIQPPPQEMEVGTIITETVTESPTVPKKARAISDKANINQAPEVSEDNMYNAVGNPSRAQGPTQNQTSAAVQDQGTHKAPPQPPRPTTQTGGGDAQPTVFDPERPPVIRFDTKGNVSLATIPKDYASYFLKLKDQIIQNYEAFFPVFQYYQKLIPKAGESVVLFRIQNDGSLQHAQLSKKLGYEAFDQAALNSIKYTKSIGPLPKELQTKQGIPVQFHFIFVP